MIKWTRKKKTCKAKVTAISKELHKELERELLSDIKVCVFSLNVQLETETFI